MAPYEDDIAKTIVQVLPPRSIDTPGRTALWRALEGDTDLALEVDAAIRSAAPDDWRANIAKRQAIKAAVFAVVGSAEVVERVFAVIVEQEEY